jgi:hypothetical protein
MDSSSVQRNWEQSWALLIHGSSQFPSRTPILFTAFHSPLSSTKSGWRKSSGIRPLVLVMPAAENRFGK